MKKYFISFILIALVSFGFAQNDNPLEINLEAFIVSTITKEDGSSEELFSAAESARPGQIVEYRVSVKNSSDTSLPAGNAAVTGPIPAGTMYQADSASFEEAQLEFSADGGQSFSMPPVMMIVVNEEGKEVEVEASPEDYTALRWNILKTLEPDEVLVYVYRVIVR